MATVYAGHPDHPYGRLQSLARILDFTSRHDVTGTVIMAGSRQCGGILPRFVQELVVRRGRDGFGQRNDDNR